MEETNIQEIKWREKLLCFKYSPEHCSDGTYSFIRRAYRVLGFKKGEGYDLIPKKLQKNCRAFLRGTQKGKRICGLAKIIFNNK